MVTSSQLQTQRPQRNKKLEKITKKLFQERNIEDAGVFFRSAVSFPWLLK